LNERFLPDLDVYRVYISANKFEHW
jgi:hypothetical protein